MERLARRLRETTPRENLENLSQQIAVSAEPLPWTPEQYIAQAQVAGGLIGLALGPFTMILSLIALGGESGWNQAILVGVILGLILGTFVALGYPALVLQLLAGKAKARARAVTLRLPFAVDLIALMMEAGASFQESLEVVVRESQGIPLGEELGQVLRDIRMGKTRRASLADLAQRLMDQDVSEIVFAVNKGEELGTPLSQILKSQAQQLRLKRSQWLEKAASEAQVKIVFPGMIVMVACLIVIAAPFVLNAVFRMFS